MAEFECKTGECVKCCTHEKLAIPVTLPDLYRACIYAREVEGRNLTIPQAYRELCGGWMYLPDPSGTDWVMPCPKSKIPCPSVDVERKVCTVHDSRQYIACRHYPEGMLLESTLAVGDSPESEGFWRGLECMQGVSLTPEREERLKKLCSASSFELALTGKLLHNKAQPVSGKTRKEIEAEFERRIKFFDQPGILRQFLQNMRMNGIQEKYMELFEIESPDYTQDTLLRGGAGRKPGKNSPCPCGSGKKFKRCCGMC